MDLGKKVKQFSRCICANEEKKAIIRILNDSREFIEDCEQDMGRKVSSRLLMKIARDLVVMKQHITGEKSVEEASYLSDLPVYQDYARMHNRVIKRCRGNIFNLLTYSSELRDYFLGLFNNARTERHHGQNYVGVHCTDQMRLGICGSGEL